MDHDICPAHSGFDERTKGLERRMATVEDNLTSIRANTAETKQIVKEHCEQATRLVPVWVQLIATLGLLAVGALTVWGNIQVARASEIIEHAAGLLVK
mgnify:CR=1 FL=1